MNLMKDSTSQSSPAEIYIHVCVNEGCAVVFWLQVFPLNIWHLSVPLVKLKIFVNMLMMGAGTSAGC